VSRSLRHAGRVEGNRDGERSEKKGRTSLDRPKFSGPTVQFRVARTIETLLLTERMEAIAATAISDTIMVSSTIDAPCWFLMTRRKSVSMRINPFQFNMVEIIINAKGEVNRNEAKI
jgi:hypothetical protein